MVDDQRLRSMFEAAEATHGWGRNHTLSFGRERVFVKRVPLTELEYENRFSTRNLYELPTYYNYGIGSAGFGVFRELLANIRTTNWVLGGEVETFPLLYHYRICRVSKSNDPIDEERHEGYVRYWGGNENIGRYMRDRANAPYEMVLCFEHIPTVLFPWLKENPGRTPAVVKQLGETFDFLNKKGIIHFDAHLHNILVDAERPYLTDFGLALDKSFDLSEEERRFFSKHRLYDYAEALSCLTFLVNDAVKELSEFDQLRVREVCGIEEGTPEKRQMRLLLTHLEELNDMLRLDSDYLGVLLKHMEVMVSVREFYMDLRQNPKKDTPFPASALRRQLLRTGFVNA